MNMLWWRQIQGILRMEVKKNLFSSRALPIYILCLIPIGIVMLFIGVSEFLEDGPPDDLANPGGAQIFFAVPIFQMSILRSTLFFGCVWIFMNLFRGEVLDRSLHYYFLAPVRREVLIAGKFLSAWVGAVILFGGMTSFCYFAIYTYLDPGSMASLIGHWLAYMAIVAMATLGYGAIFMTAGLFMKNPVVPAIIILLWENFNPFLPSFLKKLSVIHYMQALYPVDVTQGPVAILAESVSLWIAVPGFILFATAMLLFAGFQIRRMEIHYADD